MTGPIVREYRCGKMHDFALPFAEREALGRKVLALKGRPIDERRGAIDALARAYGVHRRTAYRYATLITAKHICVCFLCDRRMAR